MMTIDEIINITKGKTVYSVTIKQSVRIKLFNEPVILQEKMTMCISKLVLEKMTMCINTTRIASKISSRHLNSNRSETRHKSL